MIKKYFYILVPGIYCVTSRQYVPPSASKSYQEGLYERSVLLFTFFLMVSLMLVLYIIQLAISRLVQLISIFAPQHLNSKILATDISLSDL